MTEAPHRPVSLPERVLLPTAGTFAVAFALTCPFDQPLLPDTGSWFLPITAPLSRWTGTHLWGQHPPQWLPLLSDSTALWVHAANLLVLSLLFGLWVWGKRKIIPQTVLSWLSVFLRIFLATHLLLYGFQKVFGWQFYPPEPNLLHTPFGELPPDLLFWSTMGTSTLYSIATGIAEVGAALCLLFRPTLRFGIYLSLFSFAHIALINLAFDISVKLFSLFLLFCTVLLWWLLAQRITNQTKTPSAHKKYFRLAHTVILLLLLLNATLPYIRAGYAFDSDAPRPPFHGAYEVESFIRNGDTLPPLTTDTTRWRRLFIHRRHYLIVQGMNDRLQDWEWEPDTAKKYWWIAKATDSVQVPIRYLHLPDSSLRLETILHTDTLEMIVKKLPWQNLPAVQKGFRWRSD